MFLIQNLSKTICTVLFLLLLFVGVSFSLYGQNLVPNYSFEILSSCPSGFGVSGPSVAPPWGAPTLGSFDVFNECASFPLVLVPSNIFGFQEPLTGAGYAGAVCKIPTGDYREYMQAPLIEPLTSGTWYYVSFYVSLAENYCGIEHLGAYFSVDPVDEPIVSHLDVIPQVESNSGFLNDYENWMLISGCFLAEGGEAFITIGNFNSDAESPIDPACGTNISYYYVEDISVVEGGATNDLFLDLQGPVVACFSYEIDPGISGYTLTWEDGSHEPTLIVTESGVYSLTISDGCSYGVDSIEVTINGNNASLHLGTDTLLCLNTDYTLELDPNLGEYTWQDGSNDPFYIITTAGTYAVTLDDGCSVYTDEIVVEYLDPPAPVDLGEDGSLCPDDIIEFSFDPTLGQFLWQNGSSSSSFVIDQEGTYSLTISNFCGVESDEIILTSLEIPEVNIGPDQQTICTGEILDIEIDPALGDILWQDGSDLAYYQITSSGIYTVFVTNACGTGSDAIEVTALNSPDIDLGIDTILCAGQTLLLASSQDGSYLWQDNSVNDSLLVTATGTYALTVTNFCGEDSDSILVTFLPNLTPVDFGPDFSLCPGEEVILNVNTQNASVLWQDQSSADTFLVNGPGTYSVDVSNLCGSVSDTILITLHPTLNTPNLGPDVVLCPGDDFVLYGQVPGVQYLWSDGSMADSLLINIPGTYYVHVFDQCTEASDTIIVGLNSSPPQVNLPVQLLLCQGQTLTLDANVSGVSYLWNDNSPNQQITVASPGVYSLTVSNACGTDVDTTIILDGGIAPVVELGNDVDLCPGETVVLSPAYANVDTWLWNDGSTLDSIVVSGTTQIFVEVNNSCGSAYDTLNTNLLPATPPLDLGADTSLCSDASFILSINTPGVTVLWPDGATGSDFLVSGAGIVYASIANSCGQSFDTIQIDPLPDIPTLNLGADQSLCPGEIILLSPGIANVSYEWHDGSTNNSYQSTQEETIILTITNACGAASDTLEVFESTNGPQVDLGPDILACEGDTITVPSGNSGVDYLWQDGSTDPDFTTSISNTLILQVSNLCGTDTDTLIVDIQGVIPTPQLGVDTSLCEGILWVLYSTADAETTVTWQDGSTQRTYFVDSPGIYSLHESNHCGSARDTIVVDFINAPDDFTLGPDTTLCPGESIILTAPSTTYDLQWQDGSNQGSIMANEAITYSLHISNECGTKSDSLFVSIDSRTPAVDLDPSISWCEGDIITLDATQLFDATYYWSTGETTPFIQVSSTGVYNLDISTPCAFLSQTVDIIPGTDCFVGEIHDDIYIPNVFSPNGDGINDVFTVSYGADLDVIGIEGSIFDRWGNVVYQSNESPFRWDGLFAGEVLMPGVFAYIIKIFYLAEPVGKTQQVFMGDITLLR